MAPPCNHYSDNDEIKGANRRLLLSIKREAKKSSPSTSRSPHKVITGRPAPHKVPKRRVGDRLNRTTYNTDPKPINDLKYKNKMQDDSKIQNKDSANNKSEGEDSALPIIKDEDNVKNNDEVNNQSIVSKEVKVLNTEVSDKEMSKGDTHSQPAPKRLKNANPNAMYEIRRKKINQPHNRLYSHQNRTKMRIQGKHGVKSEKYVDLQKSLEEQKKVEDRKRFVMRAKQRHKVQERIERYREEKIQREIELLEEAKRLEQEERRREKIREDRRYTLYMLLLMHFILCY